MLSCAFCGKDQGAVRKLIAGRFACICDGCARITHEIVVAEDLRAMLKCETAKEQNGGLAVETLDAHVKKVEDQLVTARE